MKILSLKFSASGTKRLPKNLKIYGIKILPESSTFAAGADGYFCARLIDKNVGTMDIADEPVLFGGFLAVKANVMAITEQTPIMSKWIRANFPFVAVVVSTITALVLVYCEDGN